MATNLEIIKEQRRHLHTLLNLRHLNKGISIEGLELYINLAETEMPAEDVSYVREKIALLHKLEE
ncbi:MAG: hypothetical protein LBE35_09430 [Clostridiales bacterium]|jgi:hypothetical protein|nr:hypothetical protein [Clostridiales bacterium]